jgi:hypothetical protein
MAQVFASGSRPAACAYGHPWNGKGSMILSWVTCNCAGVQASPAGLGHHRIRCLADDGSGGQCPSVWYDPPHTPDGDAG